jgi:hypothetical protein
MVEVANDFMRAADALNLSPAAKDKAFARALALGLSPDDPASIHVAMAASLEALAGDLVARIDAAPRMLEAAAKRAVGPVAEAAAERARASMDDLQERTAADVGEAVGKAAEAAFESLERGLSARVGANWIIAMASATALMLLVGIWIGGAHREASDNDWMSLAQRADAPQWSALIHANTDLNATLSSYCASGAKSQGLQDGRRWCATPLWLEPAPSPGSAATVTVWTVTLGWLDQWSPATLLAAGLVGGLLVRRIAKLVASPAPIRWLLDI